MTIRTERFPRPPDKRENARRATADAIVKAGGLFTAYDSRTSGKTQLLAGHRYERQVVCVHNLGPRVFGELLIEVAVATGRPDIVADRLQAYAALDAEVIRAVGGDRFPAIPLQVVR